MAIKKKNTKKCTSYYATRIQRTYMQDGSGWVEFISNATHASCNLRVTREEYAHITQGAGTTIDAFDKGLTQAFRYYFRVDTEKVDNYDTVTAVSAIPTPSYMDCDWEEELQRRIPEGGVLCTFRDNGGIDINCFPAKFRGYENALLDALSGLAEISNTTVVELDSKTSARVRSIDGSEAMIVLRKAEG